MRAGIHCMSVFSSGAIPNADSGRVLSVGSHDGTTTVFECSESLSRIQSGEKQAVQAMFEREQKREKTLEARRKELRAAAARKSALEEEEAAADGKKASGPQPGGPEALKAVEKEFYETVAQEEEKEEKRSA